MSVSKNMRVVFSLVVGGMLLVGLFLLLDGASQIARADPGALFVKTDGTGTNCTQANPCALQTALGQAVDSDVIYVAGGAYTGTGAAVITVTKNIILYGGWNGITGTEVLPGVYTTTLDGENVRRVVYITGTVSPILDGFTLRNGRVLTDSGGAVYAHNASPVINRCRILSSTADYGGGVAFWYGVPTLGKSVVMNNVASLGGGGVYVMQSAVAFEANTILGNQASQAGGLEIVGSGSFTMTNNIVARNRSTDGSSVRVYGISDHPACPGECPSQGRLLHNTFVTNTSSNTSWMINVGPTATLTLINTIIGRPGGVWVEKDCSATLDKTLWETGLQDKVDGSGNFAANHGIDGDPAFVDPNGGNYHIGLASAAIDQGVNAGVGGDIDGQPRPQGSGYDIGADETGMVVTKQAEPDVVRPGGRLVYTIRVTNTSDVNLNATITDTLPFSTTLGEEMFDRTLVLPGGTAITWTAPITRPGGVWTETVVVTAEVGYVGPLTNVVQVTTEEGAKGGDSVTVKAGWYLYVPIVMRGWP